MPLKIDVSSSIKAQNGGLFVSKSADWVHPQRVLGSFELVFVKQGVLRLREEVRAFDVHPGEALLLWPNRQHGGIAPSSRHLKFYWVHFTTDARPGASSGEVLQILQHVRIARPDQMTALFRHLLNDQELFGAKSVTLGPLIALMLCEAARSGFTAAEQAGASSVLAAKAEVVIQNKFSARLTASSIAAQLQCNPDYLGRVFRAVYGKTLTDALHERRVRHATTLLAETGTGIDEIGRLCGFTDAAYFRRIFRRHQEMAPGAWRALYTRTHINSA